MADAFTKAKYRWLDRLRRDGSLKVTTRLVGAEIAAHFSRVSKDAWPSQETIRKQLGFKNVATVKRAIAELKSAGYISVTFDSTKRKSNTYTPIFSIEDGCCRAPIGGGSNAAIQRGTGVQQKWRTDDFGGDSRASQTFLSKPIQITSPRSTQPSGRGEAVGFREDKAGDLVARTQPNIVPQPEAHQDGWQSVRAGLAARLGPDRFNSWFCDVTLREIDGQEVVLTAPTAFTRDRLAGHYLADLEHCWRAVLPTISVVRVVLAERPGIAASRRLDGGG